MRIKDKIRNKQCDFTLVFKMPQKWSINIESKDQQIDQEDQTAAVFPKKHCQNIARNPNEN